MNLSDLFLFSAGVHGVILTLLLMTYRKGSITANIILSIVILTLSIELFSSVENIFPYGRGIELINPINLLIAPLFYLFIVLSVKDQRKDLKSIIYPLLPIYILPTILYFKDFSINSTRGLNLKGEILDNPAFGEVSSSSFSTNLDLKSELLNRSDVPEITSSIFEISPSLIIFILLNTVFYLLLSFKEIREFRNVNRGVKKDVDYYILTTLITIWLISSISFLLYLVIDPTIFELNTVYSNFKIVITSIIFIFTYINLRRPVLLHKESISVIDAGIESISSKSKSSSTDSINQLEPPSVELEKENDNKLYSQYSSKILELMETEKLYLDCDLTLERFAEKANIHYKLLSKVINNQLSKSFNDFINEYRLDEVKKQLIASENSKKTIISIAYECGFNSKSSFNSLFKKSEGITPTEFRRSRETEI